MSNVHEASARPSVEVRWRYSEPDSVTAHAYDCIVQLLLGPTTDNTIAAVLAAPPEAPKRPEP